MEQISECSRRYFLSAGETDAQSRMPMSLIIERAIEIATEHANRLGIGYATLITHGIGWVLTRISVQMIRYPRINEHYTYTTWIEGLNRLYSDRCFRITDDNGEVIGHIRSMWVAIDMEKRTAADLSAIESDYIPIMPAVSPVPKQRKMGPLPEDARVSDYTFKFSDIDFNRHVNTVQYIRLLLNQWPLDFFDANKIKVFEVAFHQECYFGDKVQFRVADGGAPVADGQIPIPCEICKADSSRALAANIVFTPRG